MTHDGFSPIGKRLFFLIWLGLTAFLLVTWWRQHYPGYYVVELQVQLLDGSYFPKLTALILLLAAAIPAFIIGLLFDLTTRQGFFQKSDR